LRSTLWACLGLFVTVWIAAAPAPANAQGTGGAVMAVATPKPTPIPLDGGEVLGPNMVAEYGPRFPDGEMQLTSSVKYEDGYVPCLDCGKLVEVQTPQGSGFKLELTATEKVLVQGEDFESDYKYERANGSFIIPKWDGRGVLLAKKPEKSGFMQLDFIDAYLYDSAPPNPVSVSMQYGVSLRTKHHPQQATSVTYAGLDNGPNDCDECGGLVIDDVEGSHQGYLHAEFAPSAQVTLIDGSTYQFALKGRYEYREINNRGFFKKRGKFWGSSSWRGTRLPLYRKVHGVQMLLKDASLADADGARHSLPSGHHTDPETGIKIPSGVELIKF
jgi:hypothetical protein